MEHGQPRVLRPPSGAGLTADRAAGGWLQTGRLAAITLVMALSPSTYDRRMLQVTARQIYFSAWQALPGFAVTSAVLAYVLTRILIGTAAEYGLSQYGLELTVRVVVIELLPLLAALFVGLRSGAAISARVALMREQGEFERLTRAGSDPLRHALVSRAIGSVVAVAVLCACACALALVLAYGAAYGLSPWAVALYLRVTGQVFAPHVVVGLALKILLFGLAVASIPIGAALSIQPGKAQLPIAVMRAMVRLALALVAIEIGFLAVLYA